MPRTVVVDTDGDAVLFDQLVQQVKAVGIGIDRQVSEAHGAGEFEDLAVGRLVLAQANHTPAVNMDAGGLQLVLDCPDLLPVIGQGNVGGERFPVVHAQLFGRGEGLLQVGMAAVV